MRGRQPLTLSPDCQRGVSLVELMVGITVGLIVAAGASLMAVGQIGEHRRLLLETQVQQDLRAAADLIQQELRRAGFRGQADLGVWAPATGVGTPYETPPQAAGPSAYTAFTVSSANGGGVMATYLYARKDPVTDRYNVSGTPGGNEQFGIRWDKAAKTLHLQVGRSEAGDRNWQPIVDTAAVVITDFGIEADERQLDLGDFCEQACGAAGQPACPSQRIREVKFRIVGRAAHDANVVRTLTGVERIRADVLTGACPS